MNIHVGNLAREVTEQELRQAFEQFGQVAAVRIITDRRNSVSRGFGFIEMPDESEAQTAIRALNMKDLAGRTLDISEASAPRGSSRGRKTYGGGRGGRPRRVERRGRSGGGRQRSF